MIDQDLSRRLVILVRKDLIGWQAANTVAHISAYIGHKLEDLFDTGEFFITADKKEFPRNSQYPIIIKEAENSEQLHSVLMKAREKQLLRHAFICEMIETSSDEEIQKSLTSKPESEVEILGMGIFGLNDDIATLTKKFSLWK